MTSLALPGLPPFAATGVGSLPHTDAGAAVAAVLDRFREIPYWPQLPRRAPLEGMCVQFGAGLPGAAVEGERLFVEGGDALLARAEVFYERFLSGETAPFAVPPDRAAGLDRFLAAARGPYPAVKGQVTGPVSFGLLATDRAKRPLFYDPVGRDILVKHLLRTAQWQVARLKAVAGTVILVLDEPYLASVGSAVVALPREEVIAALDEIFDGLPDAIGGIHCCANTDWGLVLSTRARYLSFDAYGYADALLLFADKVQAFLDRGGRLAFGLVPTAAASLARETPESLADRMEDLLRKFEAKGIPREKTAGAAVITPACGLGTLSEEEAERALRLCADLSLLLRRRHGGA